MNISVVICAYTEERWADLVSAVESLQQQIHKPCEIILSIDHNPSLYKRVSEFFSEDVIKIENIGPQGLSGARNAGIAASKGDIVAFLDDDATAAPDWLALASSHFDSENVLGVGGSVQPAWPGEKAAWFPEEFLWVLGCDYKGLPKEKSEIRNPLGACMLLRRNIFRVVGGFRDGIGRIGSIPLGCEETELCIRARQKWPDRNFWYEPRSRVHHHIPFRRINVRYFLSRCYAEGISKSYITYIAGKGDGLSSERTYTLRVLPSGVVHGLADGIRGDLSGFARSGSIVMGFFATLIGYMAGNFFLLRGGTSRFAGEVKTL